jgi:hypothetical protein
MKSAAQFIQAIPGVLIAFFQFSPQGTVRRVYGVVILAIAPLEKVPVWMLISAFSGIAIAIMVVGLRSLSSDYLIRASSLVHGRSDATTRVRRSLLGEVVRRVFGGQVGRAGFDYVKRMMLRDWQFRRQILGILPMMFFMVVGLISAGLSSPFSTRFSATHFVPHVLGFMLSLICLTLPYGTDYKGLWIFLLVSNTALARFARGVHASMWLAFIVVPNALLFPLFVWRWGADSAIPFTLYSVAVSTVYLAVGLRSIDGVPFGKQVGPQPTQGSQMMGRMFVFVLVALMAVGVQYLLYRSVVAVWIGTAVIAVFSILVTKRSLDSFHAAMVHHLGIASRTSTMIYKEVGEEGEIGG